MISKERLVKEQKITGFRQEVIEKVVWLMAVLSAVSEDSYLKNRLVLKEGTALNLFYFDLPRLSVDADFNYIGSSDKETMQMERPMIEERLQKILQRLGLTLVRNPQVHAGGKTTWRYASALGNQGSIEIDLNFMYRFPLLPAVSKPSIHLADLQVNQLLLLDFHELAAGKLVALIDKCCAYLNVLFSISRHAQAIQTAEEFQKPPTQVLAFFEVLIGIHQVLKEV